LAVADSRDPRPWALAGELLARRGDRTKAQQSYEQALRLDPANEEAARSLDRLRRGLAVDDVADPQLSSGIDFDEDHGGLTAQLAPNLPGVPSDPASALRFDPLRGVRPSSEAARP
jgi:tetratricopeptide (TPR) repeat protein